MKKLDLFDKENQLNVDKISVGFAVEDEINNLKKKDLVTANQVKMFMIGVKAFLCAMVDKLFERSPLGSVVLHSASMFDPNILLNSSKEKLALYLKALLMFQLFTVRTF